jgi:hypothetical protein
MVARFTPLSLGDCRGCGAEAVPVDEGGDCTICARETDIRELLLGNGRELEPSARAPGGGWNRNGSVPARSFHGEE